MKTNGLRNKKPKCARVAIRWCEDAWVDDTPQWAAIERWHRAAKGRK